MINVVYAAGELVLLSVLAVLCWKEIDVSDFAALTIVASMFFFPILIMLNEFNEHYTISRK